ncbi:DUF3043 domain-containing protein [uncultured Propionibacterium sp.]|uniref:DUF3043 domain-containing protein n=1 Tax=uncultured Propionibacterium sp. TaxID=218066 RepID=UPI002930A910|nr:DUF3043 domain-containing protein [uncultured Propionibacterium sp.]
MALLRSKRTVRTAGEEDEAVDAAGTGTPGRSRVPRKKNAPTPSRRQAEAARMQRLHPVLTKKEQKARNRESDYRRREEAFRTANARPERVLLRNNVDSHWSACEFAWPVVLILIAAMLATQWLPWLSLVSSAGIWVYFLVCALNVFIRWRSYKKEAYNRIRGFDPRGKRLVSDMISRMITLRRFRNPGCAVERGEKY